MPVDRQVHHVSYAPAFSTSNLLYSHHGLDLDQLYIPGLSTSGISSSGLSSGGLSTIPTTYSSDIYHTNTFASPRLQLPQATSASFAPPNYTAMQSSSMPSPSVQSPLETPAQDSFRHSKFQLYEGYQQLRTAAQEPCQTDAMAGADTAHYMNEDFQPQLWEPGSEYRAGRDLAPQSRRSS